MDDNGALWLAWEGARRAWLESKRRISGSQNTVKAYQTAYRQFQEWAGRPPWEVSNGLAQRWASHLARLGRAKGTVNLKLTALSSFYEFVRQRYSVRTPDGREVVLWPADQGNPFGAVQRSKLSAYGRAKFPGVAEAQAMLAAINQETVTGLRDYALIFAMLVSCRRSSELLNLKWGDLEGLENGDFAFSYENKGQVRRTVLKRQCYDKMCEYLEAAGRPVAEMGDKDYIFTALDAERVKRLPGHAERKVQSNRPISNSLANRILKKYARRAGVDLRKAHLHGLRHTGTRLRVQHMKANGGVDYAELMEVLGHGNLAATQIYATTALEDPEDPGGEAAAMALMGRDRDANIG